MPRVMLVRPGAGSPDVLPLEAWHALTTERAFALPGDPLAERLREAGYPVADVEGPAPPRSGTNGLKGRDLLAHTHGEVPAEARALADTLAGLAAEHGDVAFVAPDEQIVKAMLERALTGDVEVEVVIGRHPRGHRLLELVKVMARLRGPGGCPWDAEQTHRTLAKHLLDETYELLDAIEGGTEGDIAEELGDLLLQVVFHAQMGTDAGAFDVDDVAQGIVDKLIRRHPHVFGDVEVSGAREVVANWDVIKAHEKQRASTLEGVPDALPALAYAQKLHRRARAAGFDWQDVRAAIENLASEVTELAEAPDPTAREDEFGDILFALVEVGRQLDIDSETALRRAARKFRDRFVRVEELARKRGVSLRDASGEALDSLWREAKSG